MLRLFFPGKSKTPANKLSEKELSNALAVIAIATRGHQSVEITVKGVKETFRSVFVGIEDKSFVVDDLMPTPDAGVFLENSTEATLRFITNGVPYKLTAIYAGATKFKSYPSVKFGPITGFQSFQKRKFFRVEPRLDAPVEIYIHGLFNESTTALDVSIGGLRFRSKSIIKAGLILIMDIRLPLVNKTLKEVKFQVLGCGELGSILTSKKAVKPYFVRGTFVGMDKITQAAIERYVFILQRETIQLFSK